MMVFERFIIIHLLFPDTTDPLWFTYCPNCFMEDAIGHVLHITLTHTNMNKGKYARHMYSTDYSFAFNTIIPHRLVFKLRALILHGPC